MALLAAYNFDDISGGILDASGNGHDITTLGAARAATGHTNSGLQCTSAAEGAGPALPSPSWAQTANRTLMCWFQVPSTVTKPSGYPVEIHLSSGDTGAWGLWGDGNGNMVARARNASSVGTVSTPFPTDGLWHHWAMTYDGTTLRIYKDGALANSAALTGPLRTDADVLWLFDGGESTYTLDDVRFYDEALDATAITSAMNTPVGDTGPVSPTLSVTPAVMSLEAPVPAVSPNTPPPVVVTVSPGHLDLSAPAPVADAASILNGEAVATLTITAPIPTVTLEAVPVGSDLDYVKVVGRFGTIVGDSSDADANPDVVWCDEGTVQFTPTTGVVHVPASSDGPLTLGVSTINAMIGSDGHVMFNGQPFVWLVDLGSSKIAEPVAADKPTYKVGFSNVKAAGTTVKFVDFSFHPVTGQDNDLALAAMGG